MIDRLLVLLGLLALFGETSVLLDQMRVISLPFGLSSRVENGEPEIGQIDELSQEVRSRGEGRLTWNAVAAGDPIHRNDTMLTGPDSTARITVRGGRIQLGPNTLIQFSQHQGESKEGYLELVVDAGRVRLDTHQSPSRLALEGADLKLAPDSELFIKKSAVTPLELEVKRGNIEVQTTRTPASVLKLGEKAELGSDLKRVEKSDGDSQSEPEEGAQAPDFYALPEAHYLLHPPERVKEKQAFSLSWNPVAGASDYELEISRSADFASVLVRRTLTSPNGKFSGLPPGTYYWRLRARKGETLAWPLSEASRFDVKKNLAAPKLKGARVLGPQGRLSPRKLPLLSRLLDWIEPSALADEKPLPPNQNVQLEFSWETVPGATGYLLEVAADPAFKEILKRVEVHETSYRLLLAPRDQFYWRVASRDGDGELSTFSSAELAVPHSPVSPPVPVSPSPPAVPTVVESRASVRSWAAPDRIEAGIRGAFSTEAGWGPGFGVADQGPSATIHAELAKNLGAGSLELVLDDNFLDVVGGGPAGTYTAAASPAAFQFLDLRGDWRGDWWWSHQILGLDYSQLLFFSKSGADALNWRKQSLFSVVVGKSFRILDRSAWNISLDGVGLVSTEGVAFEAKWRVGLKIGDLSPALELLVRPSLYFVGNVGWFRLDMAPMAVVTWSIGQSAEEAKASQAALD